MIDFAAIFAQLQDVEGLIRWGGLLLLVIIVYAESGLLFGFFLPGDSLLFTAGLLAAAGFFNIYLLIGLLIVAAILGDSTGYLTGKHLGRRLFHKKDGRFFKQEYLQKAESFYEEHGKKTIILARFIPIVRTFAPIVAGIGRMSYRTFITYNVVGGVLWVISMVGAGYFLVQLIPGVKSYLHIVIGLIIVISVLPVVHHYFTNKKGAKTK